MEVLLEVRSIALDAVEDIVYQARQAITTEVGIVPFRVVAIKERTILKTTSGKIQRKANRKALHNNSHAIIYEYIRNSKNSKNYRGGAISEISEQIVRSKNEKASENQMTYTEIPKNKYNETLHLVRSILVDVLECSIDQIPLHRPLVDFGLTSIQAVELAQKFEEKTGTEIPVTFLYEAPTIGAIVNSIIDMNSEGSPMRTIPASTNDGNNAIAIIGMSCRLPGGICSVEEFWNMLSKADDTVKEIPTSRFNMAPHYDSSGIKSGKSVSKWAGMLRADEINMFDPLHFSISSKEAECLDPRARLLLECTWEVFEAAGYKRSDYDGSKTGVFMGMSGSEFESILRRSNVNGIDPSMVVGSSASSLVGRISYTYNLRGPNLVIDTACSSSLTSVHQACRSLQNGDCEMALAGGVNLTLTPEVFVALSQTGALSPTGKCHTFSSSANGYVRAEGCGIVLLKPLSRALQDKDNICAIIRGGALNQDGLSQGLTAPNGEAQKQVIRSALVDANVSPEDIDYVECHGTGTPLGDPIEVTALANSLTKMRDCSDSQRLVIGSVKSNVGHTEVAAGVIGLIKTVLCLKNETIVPTLHCTPLNHHIDISKHHMLVPSSSIPWLKSKRKRIAGVSSFGFSGTNVHLIVEESPVLNTTSSNYNSSNCIYLPFFISARTDKSLKTSVQQLIEYINDHPDVDIHRLAYTLAAKREIFNQHRVVFAASSTQELSKSLKELSLGRTPESCSRTFSSQVMNHEVCMMFTGQGSQYPGMGKELYTNYPIFKSIVDECCEHFDTHLEKSLLSIMFADTGTSEADLLNQTYYCQPALFTLEYALYHLWISSGVKPNILIGHSIGELVAAAVGGVFSLRDACRLVALRAQLMNDLPSSGSMVAVCATEADVISIIAPWKDCIDIAAVNHLNQVILSGSTEAIETIIEVMESLDIRTKKLQVNQAFHSRNLEPMIDAFGKGFDDVKLKTPSVPIMTCSRSSTAIQDRSYWTKQIRDPVYFFDGILRAISEGTTTFIEVGPSTTLSEMVRSTSSTRDELTVISSLLPSVGEAKSMIRNLIKSCDLGFAVSFEKLFEENNCYMLDIPHYPFDRQSFNVNLQHYGKQNCSASNKEQEISTVSRYYDDLIENIARTDEEIEYITFGIFEELEPKFSWVLAFNDPDYRVRVKDKLLEAQGKLRDTAFRHINFESANSILDIGCGVGTDLIQLGQKHKHLKLDGFTISESQAQFARNRVEQLHLNNRINVLHADSAVDPFPSTYDLGIGFEVVHHIKNKDALFSNLSRSIREKGYLVFADFVACPGGVNHDLTSSYFLDSSGWNQILSVHDFKLIDIVDISQEVSYFLHDSSFDLSKEPYLTFAPTEDIVNAFESYHNLGKALAKGLIHYVLLTARKESSGDTKSLEDINSHLLDAMIPYKSLSSPKHYYTHQWVEDSNLPSVENAPTRSRVTIKFRDIPGFEPADEGMRKLFLEESSALDDCLIGSIDFIEVLLLNKRQKNSNAKFLLTAMETLQALLSGTNKNKHVLIVTMGAEGPNDNKNTSSLSSVQDSLSLSGIWGLARSVRLEVTARVICIDTDTSVIEELTAQLRYEAYNADNCNEVVYRGGKRFTPRIVRHSLSTALTDVKKEVFKGLSGAFIITGGLGGLGILTAEVLAELGVGTLVLVSREGKVKNRMQDLNSRLENLNKATNIRVVVEICDVSNENEVVALLNNLRCTYGSIEGIVHSAGAISDRLFFQQDASTFDHAFVGKALGAWFFHKHTLGDNLKHFLLFSSLTALFGNAGQTNYAAANSFLDALAKHRNELKMPCFSIQWPPITGFGMAANSTFNEHAKKTCIGPNAVKKTLCRLLLDSTCDQDPVQAIISASFLEDPKLPSPIASLLSKSGLFTQGAEENINRQENNDTLYSVISSYIGQKFDEESTWVELGLTSISSLELRNIISEKYCVDIPPSFLFDFPTPKKMKCFIEKNSKLPFKLRNIRFDEPSKSVFISRSALSTLQIFGIVLLLFIFSCSFLPAHKLGLWLSEDGELDYTDADWRWITLVIPIWMLSLSAIVLICKWLIIGRYQEKQVPVSSIYFVRYSIIDRLLHLWEFFVGWAIKDTPLIILFYKLMGAKIPWNSKINCFLRECDLIQVGVGSNLYSNISCHRVMTCKENEGSFLYFLGISIGKNSEVKGFVSLGSNIGNQCMINTSSTIVEGAQVPDGIEAKSNPAFNAGPSPLLDYTSDEPKHEFVIGIFKLLWLFFELYLSMFFLQVGQMVSQEYRLPHDYRYSLLLFWILVFLISFLLSASFCVLLKWLLIGKKTPGFVSASLWREIADWYVDFHYRTTLLSIEVLCLKRSKLINMYLKLLGMDIDFKSEIFPMYLAPSQVDLISIKSTSFSSVTFEQTRNEQRPIFVSGSNIGNAVVIHGGASISGTQIEPNSDIRGNVKGSVDSSADDQNYLIRELYAFFFLPVLCASFIPSYEILISDTSDPSVLGLSISKPLYAFIVQGFVSLFLNRFVVAMVHHRRPNIVMDLTVLSPPSRSKAVVIMYGFLGAKPKQLQNYANIYLQKECTVIFGTASVVTTMMRSKSKLTSLAMDSVRKAAIIVRDLEEVGEPSNKDNGDSCTSTTSKDHSYINGKQKKIPIIVHSFSNGGTFVVERLGELIQEARDNHSQRQMPIRDRNDLIMVGDRINDIGFEILDSAPGYLNEKASFRVIEIITDNLLLRMILKGLMFCTIYYKMLMNAAFGRESISEQFWKNMIEHDLCKRQTFIYSSMDELTDSTKVDELIEVRRNRGIEVMVRKFEDSDHVLHLRKYPKEYEEVLDKVLKACCD